MRDMETPKAARRRLAERSDSPSAHASAAHPRIRWVCPLRSIPGGQCLNVRPQSEHRYRTAVTFSTWRSLTVLSAVPRLAMIGRRRYWQASGISSGKVLTCGRMNRILSMGGSSCWACLSYPIVSGFPAFSSTNRLWDGYFLAPNLNPAPDALYNYRARYSRPQSLFRMRPKWKPMSWFSFDRMRI